ncbi:MAG: hypothetical protein ACHP84_01920 [Caulobacterales bacterium]
MRILGAAVLAITALPAVAAPDAALMNRASGGYVYFHRPGAGMATHDAAVEDCIHEASQTQEPYLAPVIGGLITQMAVASTRAAKHRRLNEAQFAANLENCMVARGWEVARLDDAEGKAIAALPQPQQAATLAPWVGAVQPHGQVVRRYAPVAAIGWNSGLDENHGPWSLSLTAGVHDLSKLVTTIADRPANWRALQIGGAKTVTAPAASAIVVRVMATAPAQTTWTFVRLDEPSPAADLPGLTAFTVARQGKESAEAKTYVIAAPPGRWRLQSVGPASFCLGGPSFDVSAGEAVFAGAFDASSPYAPDLDMGPARAELGDAALAARLKPAQWTNGETFPCGVMRPATIYALEIPGAPFAPGYQAGSHAAPTSP